MHLTKMLSENVLLKIETVSEVEEKIHTHDS